MSKMVSENSPRVLLAITLELHDTLHMASAVRPSDSIEAEQPSEEGPMFILKRVELLLLSLRKDLDTPPDAEEIAKVPLMMRIRDHVDCVSNVLTGSPVQYKDPHTTTLHELIETMSFLNRSVCYTKENLWCAVM
jgi:hypothetical protein